MRIGLGLAALGRPGYINLGRDADLGGARSVEAMEQRCHEVLDAAYDAGVRYVDAARSYGLSERFLASWFEARNLPPGVVSVGSKWGYTYVAGWQPDAPVHEVKNLSVDTLRRQIAESRSLLGDRLSLYQIHSATLESGVLEDGEVIGELVRLASEGLTIGLTVSGPRQAETIRRAMDVEVDGENPFRCVQATWNLLEPAVSPALAEAHERGWHVIVKEALANGRLTARGAGTDVRVLDQVSAEVGATRDAVALAAALAQPWADVVLSGAVSQEQMRSNLRARALQLSPAHHHALATLAEASDQYWSHRGALPWS